MVLSLRSYSIELLIEYQTCLVQLRPSQNTSLSPSVNVLNSAGCRFTTYYVHFKPFQGKTVEQHSVLLSAIEYVAQLHCRFVLSLFRILVTLDNVIVLSLRVAGLSCL